MKRLILSISMLAFVAAPANAVRNGTSVTRTSTEFANLVRITVGDNTCTGTRVTIDTVLTAAHCFGEDMSRSSFKAEYLNGDVTITQKIKVSDVVIKSRDLDQELAVFKINPLSGDSDLFIPSQIYNYQSGQFYKGEKFLFAGYGMDSSESTNKLKKGTLKFSNTKTKETVFYIKDQEAMDARNELHMSKLALEPVVDKAAELPEVVLNDCKDPKLGWRARRKCKKQNSYLLFQRELELKAIAFEIKEKEKELEEFLASPIYKKNLVKGFEMLVLKPLTKDDELFEEEVADQLPCPGDSGGPLYMVLGGHKLLVGVVSNIAVPSKVKRQSEKLKGYKICAKAFAAHYIPISMHKEFLKEFGIIF